MQDVAFAGFVACNGFNALAVHQEGVFAVAAVLLLCVVEVEFGFGGHFVLPCACGGGDGDVDVAHEGVAGAVGGFDAECDAFFGLAVPHWVTLLRPRGAAWTIALNAAAGGLLLVSADAVARTLAAPREIPVGVMTALLGAPVVIRVVRRVRPEAGR